MDRIPPLPGVPLPLLREDEAELQLLKQKIHRERGFNCLHYKDKCLRRRILVRMRARGQWSFADYAALLDRDSVEYDRLLDTLTINVTKFFRNLETWRVIAEQVVPELFAGERRQHRIWSAGCSSGEEPYSVSILLYEWASEHGRLDDLSRFRIEGTDIDRQSLDAARRGEYPDLALLETPQELRERWFSAGPSFRLRDEAKRVVTFRRHDLLSDPPPSGCSLILCRNVIIYFDREIQQRIFEAFHQALLPGGFLVLGKVETLLGAPRAAFRPVHGRERVFRKPL